ncbi:Kifc1 [Symbiodinium sp. CCMP2592]|nr:Kifc1 [Symbiodinium sp. CCMP2592]
MESGPRPATAEVSEEEEEDLEDEGQADEGDDAPPESWEEREEERVAAGAILRASQLRIECVKVVAPAQLQELVESAHQALGRVRGVQRHGLRRLGPGAVAEADNLLTQWQQRSGTIRVVVRVRPPSGRPESGSEIQSQDAAVGLIEGVAKHRGLTVSVPRRSGRPGSDEVHSFKRLDYVLSPDQDQDQVFQELRAMMPSATPGGLAGPPQSACILAYGQTGSGKTFTMHGGAGDQRGLVPRVLYEVFALASASGATVSLSAVEIYNDTAYDLLDGSAACASEAANEPSGRAFSAGRFAPPPGLSFRHGCRVALEQATSIEVAAIEDGDSTYMEAPSPPHISP